DLTVIAPDVTGINFEGEPTGKGVKPGDISVVFGFVFNQGDKIADGLKIKVTLPEQTTFAGQEEGCDYTGDRRTVSCDYRQFELLPQDVDPEKAGAAFFFPVQVSEDADGPVALKGGTFTAVALEQDALPTVQGLAK